MTLVATNSARLGETPTTVKKNDASMNTDADVQSPLGFHHEDREMEDGGSASDASTSLATVTAPPVGFSRTAMHVNGYWECPQCQNECPAHYLFCSKCKLARPGSNARKGDWSCRVKTCLAHNFAFRNDCHKCHAFKGAERVGDWPCAACKKMNFAARQSCFSCNEPKPKHLERFVPVDSRPGDWQCLEKNCHAVNFKNRQTCYRCKTPRPSDAPVQPFYGSLRPGDWICTSCSSVCYASRSHCMRCSAPKPMDAGWEYFAAAAAAGSAVPQTAHLAEEQQQQQLAYMASAGYYSAYPYMQAGQQAYVAYAVPADGNWICPHGYPGTTCGYCKMWVLDPGSSQMYIASTAPQEVPSIGQTDDPTTTEHNSQA